MCLMKVVTVCKHQFEMQGRDGTEIPNFGALKYMYYLYIENMLLPDIIYNCIFIIVK